MKVYVAYDKHTNAIVGRVVARDYDDALIKAREFWYGREFVITPHDKTIAVEETSPVPFIDTPPPAKHIQPLRPKGKKSKKVIEL